MAPAVAHGASERDAICQPRRGHRHLHETRGLGTHRTNAVSQVLRHALKIVMGQDQTRGVLGQERPAIRSPFDVDVLRATRTGVGQKAEAHFLRSVEPAPLPDGPTRHHDGPATTCERAGQVEVANAVEAQLHQVSPVGRVARRDQLGHRIGRHGFAHKSHPSPPRFSANRVPKKKKPLQQLG